MISERSVKKFCKEDISKIENYDKAINDTTQIWDCHHRTEIWWNCSRQELKDNDCYYNRKACELIFLTPQEHRILHKKGKKREPFCEEHRIKISEAMKGKTKSLFGKAFYERYGITRNDDVKLYTNEYNFYKRHGHFSWEVK